MHDEMEAEGTPGEMPASYSDRNRTDLGLRDIGRIVWHERLAVLLIALGTIVLSSAYLHIATYLYTAELRVTSVQQNSSLSGGSLGGLAAMAGLNISKGLPATPFQLYLEELKSREVAARLSRDSELMHEVFADKWDAGNRSWRKPTGLIEAIKTFTKSALGVPNYPWRPPGPAELQDYITATLKMVDTADKPDVVLSFRHKDPRFAQRMLWNMHATADELIRQRAIARSTAYVDYLRDKLATVTIAEHREALSQILSEQEKQKMLASSGLAYASEALGGVAVSPRPTWPPPVAVLLLGSLGGVFLGMMYVFARHLIKNA